MARLWRSQEMYSAQFGPCGIEEAAPRTVVVIGPSAEHKSPSTTTGGLGSGRLSTHTSPLSSPTPSLSPSPFGGSLPALTDDMLAAFQDACVRGQPPPSFSLAQWCHNQPSSALPKPVEHKSSYKDSSYNDPVFSVSDIPVDARPPKSAGALSASTGTVSNAGVTITRKTRAHFYTQGEAPVLALGPEMEDDDESSDDEGLDNGPTSSPADRSLGRSQHFGYDSPVGPKYTPKSSPIKVAGWRMAPPEQDPCTLPDSPPTRTTSSLRSSSNTLRGATPQTSNSPKECPIPSPTSDANYTAAQTKLEATTQGSPPESDDLRRDAEWKDLETSQNFRLADLMHASLSSISCNHPSKNRYSSVLALDATRVRLSPSPEDGDDYINANFVRGAGEQVYISTQAPMPNSFCDFWQMVWEQNVHVIVMLTRLIESGCAKAHKYWPTSKPRQYGDKYRVTLVNRVTSDYDYRVKEFEVECEGERRRIVQFQFLGWPDHGVPHSPDSLLHMINCINEHLDDIKQAPFVEGPAPSPRTVETESLSSSQSISVASGSERSMTEAEPTLNEQIMTQERGRGLRRCSSSQFNSGAMPALASLVQNTHIRHDSLDKPFPLKRGDSIGTVEGTSSKSTSHLGSALRGFGARPFPEPVSPPTGLNTISPSSIHSSASGLSSVSLVSSTNSAYSSTTIASSSTVSSGLAPPHYSAPITSTSSAPFYLSNLQVPTTPSNSPVNQSTLKPTNVSKGGYQVGPILVHCSAGIGRSGSFIMIHSVLEKLAAEGKTMCDVSLKQLLETMREGREGLVPHQMQYNFCYDAIESALRYKRIIQEMGISGFKGKVGRQNMQRSPLSRSTHQIPQLSADSSPP